MTIPKRRWLRRADSCCETTTFVVAAKLERLDIATRRQIKLCAFSRLLSESGAMSLSSTSHVAFVACSTSHAHAEVLYTGEYTHADM